MGVVVFVVFSEILAEAQLFANFVVESSDDELNSLVTPDELFVLAIKLVSVIVFKCPNVKA